MSFLVTGTGRCGTAWLASVLSQCLPAWYVGHEKIRTDATGRDIAASNRRLATGRIGEVGWPSRLHSDLIVCDAKAVIMRHPVRVWRSAVNVMGLSDPRSRNVHFWVYAFLLCDSLVENEGYELVLFHRMIRDKEAVDDLASLLSGGENVPLPVLPGRMNASPPEAKEWEKLPHTEKRIWSRLSFLVTKYSLEDV